MENPSAPPGKSLKYARLERERRFLLARPPHDGVVAAVAITDHYVDGTRLRVRAVVESTTGGATHYKLTQKVAGDDGPDLVTNVYLSAGEHALLQTLPGHRLEKLRLSVPPVGVDVFRGPLEGLVLAEAEFGSDDEMRAFEMPDPFVPEVTHDERFAGAALARTTRDELRSLLASFGLDRPHRS